MRPLAVVGDVHGDVNRLQAILRRLDEFERTVVFVGDYVNGAPHSSAVLHILCHLADSGGGRFHFLAGNHDLALLQYLRDGNFATFAALGGAATLHSYLGQVRGDVHAAFTRAFPCEHRKFLEGLRPCWEDEDVLVSHTGFDPERPEARTLEALAQGGDARIFHTPECPRPLVVCGHYVQPSQRPYCNPHLVCIDTGCGVAGGPLTAVLLPEFEFLSV
jgi:serine/threonine protein phosphatase 1